MLHRQHARCSQRNTLIDVTSKNAKDNKLLCVWNVEGTEKTNSKWHEQVVPTVACTSLPYCMIFTSNCPTVYVHIACML